MSAKKSKFLKFSRRLALRVLLYRTNIFERTVRGGRLNGFGTSDNCTTALAAIRDAFFKAYGCIAHRTSTVMEKAEEAFKKKNAEFKSEFETLQHAVARLVHSLLKIPAFSTTRRWRGLFLLVSKFLEKYNDIARESASRKPKDRYELPSRLFLEDLLKILQNVTRWKEIPKTKRLKNNMNGLTIMSL